MLKTAGAHRVLLKIRCNISFACAPAKSDDRNNEINEKFVGFSI